MKRQSLLSVRQFGKNKYRFICRGRGGALEFPFPNGGRFLLSPAAGKAASCAASDGGAQPGLWNGRGELATSVA